MEPSTASECRLLVDPAAGGAWNMAVDEVLLDDAVGGSRSWRFYGWSEPTLSLGYFQNVAERAEHSSSLTCQLVRRSSGGGAILHDRELTYSLALPAGDRLARDTEQLYWTIHATLVATLATYGIEAEVRRACGEADPRTEPFLCFQRRAIGDLLVGSTKICGSAQRRSRGAVLQHGSLLLETSRSAPELVGLGSLTEIHLDPAALQQAWLARLRQDLGWQFVPTQFTADQRRRAEALVTDRFRQAAWTSRR